MSSNTLNTTSFSPYSIADQQQSLGAMGVRSHPQSSGAMGERNCITFDKAPAFNLNYRSHAYDDQCFLDVQTQQSVSPGNYRTSNNYDCNTLIPTTIQKATEVPYMFFSNGYDISPDVIDTSSEMRMGLRKKYPRCRQQIFTRPYLTVPYAGRGPGNIDLETQLQYSESTGSSRSCNTLSGYSSDHYFMPLIDHMAANVQNVDHIIQESADPSWSRSGTQTRSLIRDLDYAKRCKFNGMRTEALNSEFWHNKHQYLPQ